MRFQPVFAKDPTEQYTKRGSRMKPNRSNKSYPYCLYHLCRFRLVLVPFWRYRLTEYPGVALGTARFIAKRAVSRVVGG